MAKLHTRINWSDGFSEKIGKAFNDHINTIIWLSDGVNALKIHFVETRLTSFVLAYSIRRKICVAILGFVREDVILPWTSKQKYKKKQCIGKKKKKCIGKKKNASVKKTMHR